MYENWGSHSFPYRSLLLSTTVLNDIQLCYLFKQLSPCVCMYVPIYVCMYICTYICVRTYV